MSDNERQPSFCGRGGNWPAEAFDTFAQCCSWPAAARDESEPGNDYKTKEQRHDEPREEA
jgi:hypothetical protein